MKLPDFGLAKLTQPTIDEGSAMASATALPTAEGQVMGTAAYRSPEQAEEKPVDARSNIFSFGSLLYEMVTGRRAFEGNSRISTLAAVIEHDPAPLDAGVPRDMEKIVVRCLRKDPARRFQHMDDLKVALEDLKKDSDAGRLTESTRPVSWSRRTARIWVPALTLLVLGAAGVLYYFSRGHSPPESLRVIPLTNSQGRQTTPSSSPDGSMLAFNWNGEKQDNFDIYIKMVAGQELRRLTTAAEPDVCPDWWPSVGVVSSI